MKLRYMIIGAGGVGGPVGAYLSKSGADTTLIARGKHLAVLQEHGLTLVSGENERESIPVKAIDMDGFLAAREQGAPAPDVIFVCVKGYSLADTVPFIRKAAGRDTVIIPVLNIYGTGRALQAELPELLVTDGCIYISANRIAPGVIQKHGAICRIVYGLPSHKTDHPVLQQVADCLGDRRIAEEGGDELCAAVRLVAAGEAAGQHDDLALVDSLDQCLAAGGDVSGGQVADDQHLGSAPARAKAWAVSYSQLVPGKTGMMTFGFATPTLGAAGAVRLPSIFSTTGPALR